MLESSSEARLEIWPRNDLRMYIQVSCGMGLLSEDITRSTTLKAIDHSQRLRS